MRRNVDRSLATGAILLALMVGSIFPARSGSEADAPASRLPVQHSYAPVVKRTAPAVVNIYSRKIVQGRRLVPLFDDPFFRRFFGDRLQLGVPQKRVQNSLGSGVIVAADGIIVTNHHVVAGAEEIIVVLADRREFEANLVGSDERTDLAVLKIDVGNDQVPFVELRDSDEVEVGDLVLAIGNPFGVGQTVTSGIVSAQARTQVGISDLNFFIQTDAAINPGNSGGALVDVDGRLIGINSAIYSNSGGSLGIGFAVPSNMVRSVVAGFTGAGKVVRPWLGAWGQTVTTEIAQTLAMKRPIGVLINEVYPGGPADRAGIRVGDVLFAVNGRPVEDADALGYRIATLPVGEKAELGYWRRGRETRTEIDVEAPPEDPPREITPVAGRNPLAGATVANMSPALAEELGAHRFRAGVVIVEVDPGSPAGRFGFRPGDLIVEVNGREITTVAPLRRVLERQQSRWQIGLRRGDKSLNLSVGG